MDWRIWMDVVNTELKRAKGNPIALAVTLRSSVRFAGKVTEEPDAFLKLRRSVDTVNKTTYILLAEIAAIEVL